MISIIYLFLIPRRNTVEEKETVLILPLIEFQLFEQNDVFFDRLISFEKFLTFNNYVYNLYRFVLN